LIAPETGTFGRICSMSNRTSSYVIIFLGLFFGVHSAFLAQNDIGSVSELRKDARKAFEEEDYGVAIKLYSRLLSADIKDPDYNYHYGVCLIFASPEKEEAVKYLEKGTKDPSVDKEVFFYYGRALQINYRFNDAIAQYSKYKSLVSEKEAKKMQVDHMIETCKNGKTLLRKITDIQVLDKKSLDDKDFFRSYDLSDIGGRLLVKPDEFKTPLDKKKKENSIIFLSPDKNEIYFSSYGNSDENGKDIYVIKRLPSGEYGKPVSLGYPINTEFDEDYPFLHPNGKVLYFASKGHNSMGGYDIFKSERNEETGTWGKPVNVDFAINSPDDDIMFVTDKDERNAYFASRRASEQGRIDVYHINLQRRPVDVCVFRGTYIPQKPDQGKAAKITVKNVDVNEVEAMVRAGDGDGGYSLNLPNGGKFLITVETPEGDIQSDVLIIPQQFETVPIRQEIAYTDGKMHLNTFFGQANPDDDNYSLAMELIRDKAKLDVNMSKDAGASATAEKQDTTPKTDSSAVAGTKGHKNLTNDDLIKIAEQDALDIDKEAKDARETADKALVLVNEKNEKVLDLNKKLQEATATTDATTDPSQKQIEQARADALEVQANTAQTEAVAANSFYRSLDADATKKQKESELSTQYAKDLADAIRSKSKDAMQKLDAQKEAIDKLSEEKSGADDVEASIRRDAAAKQQEVSKARDESSKLKEDISGIGAEIINLDHERGETKNDQLKEGIDNQINGLREEIKAKERDLAANDLTLGKLQKEAENLNNQAYLVHQMNEKIKSGQVTASDGSIDKDKLNEQISAYHPKVTSPANDQSAGSDSTHGVRTVTYEAPLDKTPGTAATKIDSTHNAASGTGVDKTTGTTIAGTVPTTSGDGATSKQTDKTTATGPETTTSAKSSDSLVSAPAIDARYTQTLADVATRPGTAEKEQAKADVYKAWSDDLNVALEKKTTELKNTDDPSKKKKLEDDIAVLVKDQQEKQELATTTAVSAAKLKTESITPVIAKKTDSIPATTTAVEVRKADSTAATTASSAKAPAYASKYQQRVVAGDSAGRPFEKAEAKADVYKEWTAAIRTDIATKKEELKQTSVPEEKKELKKEIKELEKDAEEKEKQEKENRVAAEKLKKEDHTPAPVLVSHTAYETDFTNKLEESDSLRNQDSKDSAKSVLYKNWSVAIQKDIDTRKQNLDGIKDPDKKKAEEQTIADLETEQIGKQAAARRLDESIAKKKGYAPTTAEKQGPPDTALVHSDFKSPQAVTSDKQKTLQEWDAMVLNRKADSVATVASTLQGDARDQKLKEASGLKDQAKKKELGAIKSESDAGAAEYSVNDQKLKQYSTQPGAGSNPSLTQAEAMNDASKAYHEKAVKLRSDADKSISDYAREESLKGAEENEKKAISNQEKAMDMYAAAYPGLKITQPEPVKDAIASGVNKTDATATEPAKTDINKTEPPAAGTNPVTTATDPAAHAKELQAQQTAREEKLKQSEPYKNYIKLKEQIDADQVVVTSNNKTADKYQLQAQEYMREYGRLMKDTVSQPDAASKTASINKAKEYEDLADRNYYSADSARAIARDRNNKITTTRSKSDEILASLDQESKATMVAMVEKELNPALTAAVPDHKNDLTSGTPAIDKSSGDGNPVKTETHEAVTSGTPPVDHTATPVNPGKAETHEAVTSGTPPVDHTATPVNPGKTETHEATSGTPPVDHTATPVNPGKTETHETVATGTKPHTTHTDTPVNPGKTESNEAARVHPATATEPVRIGAGESFMITAVESVPKRIPVDPKLPDGLLFKVQIGAFRHEMSGDKFKGLNPLTAETTPQGFYRYTAGVFTHFEAADKAKNDIRSLGFSDAFIVAFYNGKRISVNDAMAMIKNPSAPIADNTSGVNPAGYPTPQPRNKIKKDSLAAGVATGTTDATEPPHTATTEHSDNTLPAISHENPAAIAKTTNVASIQGLFYAVQVGVFSNPVSNEKLHGIQPLNSEKMANGNMRYTTGQYANLTTAEAARAKMIVLGVKDAFIVAYYNGKRLSVDEAKKLGDGGTSVMTPTPTLSPVEPVNTHEGAVTRPEPVHENPVVTPPVVSGGNQLPSSAVVNTGATPDYSRFDNKEIETTKSDTGVVYKVQIGAFHDEVPLDIANKFLLLSKRGVRNSKDENGLTVFTIGSVRNFEDAQFLKQEAIAKGIPDAFILAFRDGKKISVSEARETH
jgi:hypothetical protein